MSQTNDIGNHAGKHVVPYTEKTSSGLVNRDGNGTHTADFPREWYVAPNPPSKTNGLFDSAARADAKEKGRSLSPDADAH